MSINIYKIEKLATVYNKLSNAPIIKKAWVQALLLFIIPMLLPLLNQVGKTSSVMGACNKILESLKSYNVKDGEVVADNFLGIPQPSIKEVSNFLSIVTKIRDSLASLDKLKNISAEAISAPGFKENFDATLNNFSKACEELGGGSSSKVFQIISAARGGSGEAFDLAKGSGFTLGIGTKASDALEGIGELDKFIASEKPQIDAQFKKIQDALGSVLPAAPKPREAKPTDGTPASSKSAEETPEQATAGEDLELEEFSATTL